jgi:hypothetical protein
LDSKHTAYLRRLVEYEKQFQKGSRLRIRELTTLKGMATVAVKLAAEKMLVEEMLYNDDFGAAVEAFGEQGLRTVVPARTWKVRSSRSDVGILA